MADLPSPRFCGDDFFLAIDFPSLDNLRSSYVIARCPMGKNSLWKRKSTSTAQRQLARKIGIPRSAWSNGAGMARFFVGGRCSRKNFAPAIGLLACPSQQVLMPFSFCLGLFTGNSTKNAVKSNLAKSFSPASCVHDQRSLSARLARYDATSADAAPGNPSALAIDNSGTIAPTSKETRFIADFARRPRSITTANC